ncbi:unnamed protein product [Trichobilharzia szidati]|nr:unnamed protein product [Trichobilharzia szidati]
MFIPENPSSGQLSHSEIITGSSHDSTHGGSRYVGETRLRRSSPSGQLHRSISSCEATLPGVAVGDDDCDKLKLMSPADVYKYNTKGDYHPPHSYYNNMYEGDNGGGVGGVGIWGRLMTSLSDFRNPVYVKQRPNRVYRQSKGRFSTLGIVEPFRRLFIRRTPYYNATGGGSFADSNMIGYHHPTDSESSSRFQYSRLPFTVIKSNHNI